jgi:hypothetical protein
MSDGFLSVDLIAAPAVREDAAGVRWDFWDLVRQSGMRNVISTNDPPEIRIYSGDRDFKAVRPGRVIYCVADVGLPFDKRDRAREVLRRLAYGFHDWAAREIVSRYHRDVRRALSGEATQKSEPMGALLKIRRFIDRNPGTTIPEVAEQTGVAPSSVYRAVADWMDSGRVQVVGVGIGAQYYLNEINKHAESSEIVSFTGQMQA